MTRLNRTKVILGALFITCGVLFAVLPKDWIESRFGFEPDQGSGALELLLVLVPVALGLIVFGSVVLARRSRPAEDSATLDQ